MTVSKDEDLVPFSTIRDSLSPENQALVDQRVEAASPQIEFVKKLREDLGFSHPDFANLILKYGSIRELPLLAVYDLVTERGGKIEVNITFDSD